MAEVRLADNNNNCSTRKKIFVNKKLECFVAQVDHNVVIG